jgi:hypothetical protein
VKNPSVFVVSSDLCRACLSGSFSSEFCTGGAVNRNKCFRADPPLAVHSLHDGGDREHHCHCTEEVQRVDGSLGGDPARPVVCHRSVLVCTAVCNQVARRSKQRLNRRRPALSERVIPSFWLVMAGTWSITTSIPTLWNNHSRWKTQRKPEECLVAM